MYRRDVIARAGRGIGSDVFADRGSSVGADVYARSTVGANPNDAYGYRQSYWTADVVVPPEFPTQYFGLRVRKGAANLELCLVATADAPSGMGGQPRIRKSASTYALYLVETSDPNASAVRIRTTTGTKAVRLKT